MSAGHITNQVPAADFVTKYADVVEGKTILTTGVTPGSIGAAFVQALATGRPAMLILAGRSPSKLQQTAEAIAKINADVKVKTIVFDMLSMADVRRAAKEVNSWTDVPVIDIVVNNAGIMAPPFTLSADGIESQFAANHLAHFLFTNLIIDKLLASPESRVINVTSDGHRLGAIRWDDHNFNSRGFDTYNRWAAYGQSKTANMLFSKSLAAKLGKRGLLSYSLHPGLVFGTGLGALMDNDMDGLARADRSLGNIAGFISAEDFMGYAVSVEVGAATHVFASFEPSLKEHNGTYLLDARIVDPCKDTYKPWADHPVEAEKLWKLSEKLVGQEFSY